MPSDAPTIKMKEFKNIYLLKIYLVVEYNWMRLGNCEIIWLRDHVMTSFAQIISIYWFYLKNFII